MSLPSDASQLAAALREQRAAIAQEVAEQSLRLHPDWVDRYGELARTRAVEDAGLHVDFLAGALSLGSEVTYADYGGWLGRMLAAREVAPELPAENLRQVGAAAARRWPAFQELIERYVDAAAEACVRAEVSPPEGAASEAASLYRAAALRGDRAACLRVVRKLLAEGEAMLDVFRTVIEPTQHAIGELWAANEISVADEHLATATSRHVAAVLSAEAPALRDRRGCAVVCGVEGEHHEFGAMLVADGLLADGWDVRFLGTDLPSGAAVAAIADHDARLVGISTTLTSNAPGAIDLVRDIRDRFGSDQPRICLGGRLFRTWPELADELGADGTAEDVTAAVAWARTHAA